MLASKAIAYLSALEDQIKQDEPVEAREDKEWESSAERKETKETLSLNHSYRDWRNSQMIRESGLKSTTTLEDIGPRKVQKTANTLN